MRFILIFLPFLLHAQVPGCTDPQAMNYDVQATVNDGSCLYANTNLTANLIGDLPPELPEASGVLFLNGKLWSHNDSGSDAKIIAFHPQTGSIEKEIYVGASQVDWEALTYDNSYFYIGEFGNNTGSRTDLMIIRFAEAELTSNFYDTIQQADTISFSYPDQIDFSPSSTHDFDCEAFVIYQDSCHLFSKNRSSSFVKHYAFPAMPGTYVADLVDSISVSGQVTSAAMDSNGTLMLIGYIPPLYNSFAMLLWDYGTQGYFSGNKRMFEMGNVLVMGQQEGVCFDGPGHGYIVSEAVSTLGQDARYFEFDVTSFLELDAGIEPHIQNNMLAYPNPFTDQLIVEAVPWSNPPQIFGPDGRIIKVRTALIDAQWQLDVSECLSGFYLLHYNGQIQTIFKH